MFTQNVFPVQLQTFLEVIEIFVQFHCLSSRIETTGFPTFWLHTALDEFSMQKRRLQSLILF